MNDKLFKHFLITRFNIVQGWLNIDKVGKSTQTIDWLEERFRFFDEICFPSVSNQSTDNFIWFVLFNSETPEQFRNRIIIYQKRFKPFMPLFLKPYGTDEVVVSEIIKHSLNSSYIITTRFDNDDAIHKDYIRNIQSNFEAMSDMFISYINGYQFDLQSKVFFFYPYPNNSFVSRIELSQNLKTIWYDCSKIEKIAPVKYIRNKHPM